MRATHRLIYTMPYVESDNLNITDATLFCEVHGVYNSTLAVVSSLFKYIC